MGDFLKDIVVAARQSFPSLSGHLEACQQNSTSLQGCSWCFLSHLITNEHTQQQHNAQFHSPISGCPSGNTRCRISRIFSLNATASLCLLSSWYEAARLIIALTAHTDINRCITAVTNMVVTCIRMILRQLALSNLKNFSPQHHRIYMPSEGEVRAGKVFHSGDCTE